MHGTNYAKALDMGHLQPPLLIWNLDRPRVHLALVLSYSRSPHLFEHLELTVGQEPRSIKKIHKLENWT